MTQADPRLRAERQALKTREAVRRNASVFMPLVRAIVETVRGGGRLLLFGEGRLQLLADHAATDVVGRRHQDGSQLPADVLEPSPEGPAATARRIGPLDAVLCIVADCTDPAFGAVLEQARKRGARVLCLCIGRARLEGRADVAIDVPEPRPHRVAGLVASVLHYVSKLALMELRASPYVRPRRLDDGPRRRDAASSATGLEPIAPAGSERPPAAAELSSESASGSVASTLLDSAVGSGARLDVRVEFEDAEEEFLPLEDSGSYDGVVLREGQRVITFRCKRCREALLAGTELAGRRARCPFCDRRVKVPRSGGHPYVAAEPLFSQSGPAVVARGGIEQLEVRLLLGDGRARPAEPVDLTAEGIEVWVAAQDAADLEPGAPVRVRIATRAFLEPLVAPFELERSVDEEQETGERGRVRLLLPLHAEATLEQRRRLHRLARLVELPRDGAA